MGESEGRKDMKNLNVPVWAGVGMKSMASARRYKASKQALVQEDGASASTLFYSLCLPTRH